MKLSGITIKRKGTQVTFTGTELSHGVCLLDEPLDKIRRQVTVTLDAENGLTAKYLVWLVEQKAPKAKTVGEGLEELNKLDAKEEIVIWDCLLEK